jgi:hypothetical protein
VARAIIESVVVAEMTLALTLTTPASVSVVVAMTVSKRGVVVGVQWRNLTICYLCWHWLSLLLSLLLLLLLMLIRLADQFLARLFRILVGRVQIHR